MARPRILYVFTGGTISMKQDPETGAAVPALSGREILALVPPLADLADAEVIDFARLPGPHMTPARMWDLSELLRHHLARPEIDGVVVTHGTDTLEESAYFCDLRHSSEKPAVFVGAMRNSSELSFDGPANLLAAARTAAAPQSRGRGVLVVLNQVIHAAAWATKTDTQAVETFESPVFGPLGLVEPDGVHYLRDQKDRVTIEAARYEPRVDLLSSYAGADGRFVDHALDCGARGIVIEGTGRGNVTPAMLPAIQKAIERGIPVVIATRCLSGRVLDTYGYVGSGRDLRQRGVLFAGTLNGRKARIRLMLALGRANNPNEIKSDF
jgi:L-asparaginase